jgi:hypothetical protein
MPVSLPVASLCRQFRAASKVVVVTVRVQDSAGVAGRQPDELWTNMPIGTYHGKAPVIPAHVSGRDATGRTMAVVVQPGLPATILVSSASFALADDKGNALGPGVTQVSLPSGTVVIAASTSATAPPLGTAAGDGEEVREAA